jgi:hypothetical protein
VVEVPQDQVARASDAIYGLLKVGHDCLVLARAALMAACPPPSVRRERQRQCDDEARVQT